MAEKKENLLLASLPREERQRLDPFLEWAEVEVEVVLIEPDEPIRQVFFPFDAVTSTLQELASVGELRPARVEAPGGERVMYFTGEVLALRRRLRGKTGSGVNLTAFEIRLDSICWSLFESA